MLLILFYMPLLLTVVDALFVIVGVAVLVDFSCLVIPLLEKTYSVAQRAIQAHMNKHMYM